MSKYRIHRVTDKDKAFNDLLDEAGYDYEDQAVYCLTDKRANYIPITVQRRFIFPVTTRM